LLKQVSYLNWLTRTAILLAILIVIQMVGLPQPFTGPIVNFILFFTISVVDLGSAVVIGAISPWIAFSRGILPPPLGPMIPFIIMGNVAMVFIYKLVSHPKFIPANLFFRSILGVLAGALIKYLILSSAVKYFVQVPAPIAQMMSLPQLFTALGGGLLFLIIDPLWKKANKKR